MSRTGHRASDLVRLRLTLLGNTLKRSAWQTIGIVLAALSALSVVGTVVVLALLGGNWDAELTGQLLVILGAVAMVGWWLFPIFMYGVDATLDPGRFATFGIPRRTLLTGLTGAGMTSIPGIATVLAFAGAALAWWRHPFVILPALVGALLAVLLCIVGSRALTTMLAPLMESRRSREVMIGVGLVLIMAISPLLQWLGMRLEHGLTLDAESARALATDAATAIGWSPLGAPWALASAAYAGNWIGVGLRFLIAVGTLAGLLVLWNKMLARSLEQPREANTKAETAKGLGLFGKVPASPTWAVAARAATYWWRDPRYSQNLLVIPFLPFIMWFAGNAGDGEIRYIMLSVAPMIAWILGLTLLNDIGMDYTAFALHTSVGVSGKADRWGRLAPVLLMGTPLLAAMAAVSAGLTGRWEWLPPILGVSLGMFAATCGISAAVGARWVFPAVKPGESPFKQPQGAAIPSMISASVSSGLTLAFSLPALGLALAGMLLPNTLLAWLALPVGIGLGVVVLVFGVRIGARIFDNRGPELLDVVKAFP